MVLSHALLYYVYACWSLNNGYLVVPSGLADARLWVAKVAAAAAPTQMGFTLYLSFLFGQVFLVSVLPGMASEGTFYYCSHADAAAAAAAAVCPP